MIKFFRKIRQQMVKENKVSKYMLYAIGEIVLVVIGILIALQINSWNEQRKFREEGLRTNQELHTEFSNNRIVLKERIKDLENANGSVRFVLSHIDKEKDVIQKFNMDSIITQSLKYGNYNPSNSTILELISSGKLNLIVNKSLKKDLYKWLQLLKDTDEDFKNQDQQATTALEPYLSSHISIKNLNLYENLDISEKSELFKGDYHNVFHDLKFENLFQSKLLWNTTMINHYKELDSLAIDILNQIKSN